MYQKINEEGNNEDNKSITFNTSPKEKIKRSTSANPITSTPEDSKSKTVNGEQ